MVSNHAAIQHLVPGAVAGMDYGLAADGSVAFWRRPEPQPTPAEIEAARLPATKAQRIEQDRQECRRRLTEHYGDALEQTSRFAGGYGEFAKANILTGTVAARIASNVARDQINAATTVAEVEAVTVSWPVLT
jgi:hypothetical protein